MTADDLYWAISEVQKRKRDEGEVPDHVLRVEDLFSVLGMYPPREIDLKLRELLNAGRIEAGRTINDTWIRTK